MDRSNLVEQILVLGSWIRYEDLLRRDTLQLIELLKKLKIKEQERLELERRVAKGDFDNQFKPYINRFKESVQKHGFEQAFEMFTAQTACGCMGPRDGEPYCPCEMHTATACMFGKKTIEQIKPLPE